MASGLRVQFVHGLEGSPQGSKARRLAHAFEAITPAMDTADFEACVALHARTLASFRPDVLVGSSFGGAVAVALLQRGHWRGPTLLLAQAAQRQGLLPWLPEGVRVWLVHATGDPVVPVEDSRALAARGSPDRVRLVEVDDDHPLHAAVARGDLERWVRAIARQDAAGGDPPGRRSHGGGLGWGQRPGDAGGHPMESLRDRQARERRLDPERVHVFALTEYAAALREEPEYRENGHTGVLLMRTDDLRMLLAVAAAGASVDDHVIRGPATVQVVQGALDVEVDGTHHAVGEGEIVVLPHDVPRKITARAESAFVLSLALRQGS